ncbi:hypothetical protein BLA23254_01728 [Burkholderia lata]|uniref:Uncharacterized protein n=1 Tax=Burkholderia lata (strain ATCC 17760 / DSM 23089 / LMG 22485 / NCIMB 9086 / R18194 / 383) TaxID=482957 RepID=A0A6P2J5I5_BURL3|nr:hypothetical protein BLA23254_01728 [Burkholderia lata]
MLSRAEEMRAASPQDANEVLANARSRGAPAARGVRSGAGRLLAYLTWSAIGCRNAEKPVSMICTPMHSSRNADTRFATLVPSLPR